MARYSNFLIPLKSLVCYILHCIVCSTYFVGCPPPADPSTNRTADRFDYNMQAKDPFLSPLKEYVDFRETIRCVQTLVDNSIYLREAVRKKNCIF